MRISLLLTCVLCLLPTLIACGEDETSEEPTATSTTPQCACEGDQCAEGQCVLKIVLGDACGDAWGTAQVWVNDIDPSDTPAGTVEVGKPFTTCDPFQARVLDADGNVTQPAEPFRFVVESEDTRLLSGSVPSDVTFECAGSAPFVWTIDQNCN